jgi:alkylation response protein AidB-like acyl-CoA dehydrogenase
MSQPIAESVESFTMRARPWIESNLPTWDEPYEGGPVLQNRLFDAGYAGIAFPAEYGGAGLTLEHQKAFFDLTDSLNRQVPMDYLVSMGMLGPTILDHGSHEAKRRFLPPLLRGDEMWIQLLSEPRGGSDMAGAITRLTRDGDVYVLNGSKMWSSGAHHSDWGLCLCRSDWDAPKHRGLSMIAVPLKDAPGMTINVIRTADGRPGEFCEEFFDDVVLPVENLIGEENSGWVVAQTLLFHERNATGSIGFGHLGARTGGAGRNISAYEPPTAAELARTAVRSGVAKSTSPLIADAYIDSIVNRLTADRITKGLHLGTHQGHWGSLSRLQTSTSNHNGSLSAMAVLGADAVMWEGDEVRFDNAGTRWLTSRGATIAGGSSEMQRNIISERLLALPREPSSDRDLPFNEVIRNLGNIR